VLGCLLPHLPLPSQADEVAKVNRDLDRSLGLFAHFLRCYKDDRCAGALTVVHLRRPVICIEPLAGATTLDNDSREAYLTALFSCARIFSKTIAVNPRDRVPDMRARCVSCSAC
jgi:hypothetical protein